MSEDGAVDYYLPAGRWTHLLTGEVQAGGRWYRTQHDFFSLPLFVRPGSVVPLGAVDDRPDYEFADGVTFRVYELADGAELTCDVPTLRGTTALRLAVRRAGLRVRATVEGDYTGGWRLQLAGVRTVAGPLPVSPEDHPLGVILSAGPGVRQIECDLSSPPPDH